VPVSRRDTNVHPALHHRYDADGALLYDLGRTVGAAPGRTAEARFQRRCLPRAAPHGSEVAVRITANGLRINWQLTGPENAPVVVLSHSLGSSGIMWDWQVPMFVERFRVLRYDTRGHGGTDAPAGPYHLDSLGDDAIGLLDALDIQRVHWVGLSMGGMIGQNLALRHPQRLDSLVLCDTTSEVPPEARATWDERIATAEMHGLEPLCAGTMERWFTPAFLERNPEEVQVIRQQFLQTPTSGYVGCCQAICELDYTDRLSSIALPVQIIVGAQDPSAPPSVSEMMQERISGAALTVIDDAAHLSNVEQPRAFNNAAMRFLMAL